MDYGGYVLSSEADEYAVNWENAFGRFIYESRFAGRRPLLDIGPGRCWFVRQAPSDIVGLELEEALVARYRSSGLDVRQGTIYDLPFEEGEFDGAFCCWLFEHLHDPVAAASELRRVLSTSSPLCIVVPSERQLRRGFYDDLTHIRPYTRRSLAQLAALSGFSSWTVSDLVQTVGMVRISRLAGADAAQRYLRLMDGRGRRLGLVNRKMLVLDAVA